VALLTTAALHRRGDEPFRALEEPLGDTGHRVVPHATSAAELDLDAPYVDPKYVVHDPEVALPSRALDALARRGRVAGATERHHSFCGGVLRPFPGLRASLAEVAECLREDGAGAVVLAPNCSLCVHTAALLAGELEERGFPTVALSLLPELSRIVGVPRTLTLRFPFGAPFGDPHNAALHAAVLDEALGLLETAEPGEVRPSAHAWRRAPQ
jgi:D-proline reductase (dithiol) PrdB